jgi:hypothetical protein
LTAQVKPIKQEPTVAAKALAVYNVMRLKEVPLMQLRAFLPYLREHFSADFPQEWVDDGIAWLIERGFVTSNGIIVSAKHLTQQGLPARLTPKQGVSAVSAAESSTP